jgi:hypothetical protein
MEYRSWQEAICDTASPLGICLLITKFLFWQHHSITLDKAMLITAPWFYLSLGANRDATHVAGAHGWAPDNSDKFIPIESRSVSGSLFLPHFQ